MIQKLFFYASPQNFYPLAGKLWPVFACLATGLTVWGLWLGMFVAPAVVDDAVLATIFDCGRAI